MEDTEAFVLKQLLEFLTFAAWLCAALWGFSQQERNRLTFLESERSESFAMLVALLRLDANVSIGDLQVNDLPEPLQVFFQGELTEATADPFIQLPKMYLEILKDVRKRPCSACGRVPEEPALCLLCGALVCLGSKACRGADPLEGQCTEHARRCSSGQSLFLLPFMAQILAVSAPDCCLWDCPYVDKNGEHNPYLRRPCAMSLTLDVRCWDSLRQIFTKSAVRREIFLYNEKTGQYIPNAL
ncbi:unnamed protein product [Effrenium voratum]|uniref:E3 ubiquitin-protein ligase n=1 Tax=Effrenium voratum TaxID=2562239 RepID=A0AA36J5Y3_9DINO|nr:unnamed protein product [Effrenium voratum]